MKKVESLRYPNMRDILKGYLSDLSNLELQKSKWVATDGDLDYAIHFLFDDTKLSDEPTKCIGWFLWDEREANAVFNVTVALDKLLNLYGVDLKDGDYISKPEWGEVVVAARKAIEVLGDK